MTRQTRTSTEVSAGCFDCSGTENRWMGKNAMALAARHHDSTGHETWAVQELFVRYGERKADVDQGALFEDAA